MAAYCKTCSEEIFGKDYGDLADTQRDPCGEDEGYSEICEGCGFILVNEKGECVDCDLRRGKPGHGTLKLKT
jgi:hypothetical protein